MFESENQIRRTNITFLLALFFSQFVPLALQLIPQFQGFPLLYHQLLSLFPFIVVYFIVARKNPLDVLQISALPIRSTLLIILLVFMSGIFVGVLTTLSRLIIPETTSNIIYAVTSGSEDNLLAMIVGLAVMPAILEEIIFRGIILSGYREENLLKLSIMNGFMFGLFHLNLDQFVYAFALGIILTYLVVITGSILSGMLFHFLFNLSTPLVVYFLNHANTSPEILAYFKETPPVTNLTFPIILELAAIAIFSIFTIRWILSKLMRIHHFDSDLYQRRFSDHYITWPIIIAVLFFIAIQIIY
jgi:hypothetical protein